jgi:hypothetical protein
MQRIHIKYVVFALALLGHTVTLPAAQSAKRSQVLQEFSHLVDNDLSFHGLSVGRCRISWPTFQEADRLANSFRIVHPALAKNYDLMEETEFFAASIPHNRWVAVASFILWTRLVRNPAERKARLEVARNRGCVVISQLPEDELKHD